MLNEFVGQPLPPRPQLQQRLNPVTTWNYPIHHFRLRRFRRCVDH
jgi:hypothetical protein